MDFKPRFRTSILRSEGELFFSKDHAEVELQKVMKHVKGCYIHEMNT